jgi:hypothetical protein
MDPFAEPLRFALYTGAGVALVVSSAFGGYRAAQTAGIDPGIGAFVGVVVGVASGLLYLSP